MEHSPEGEGGDGGCHQCSLGVAACLLLFMLTAPLF